MVSQSPKIHSPRSGAWITGSERGGYYCLCRVGVWIEFQLLGGASGQQPGARWTLDRWRSHRDTPARLIQGAAWRIEIENAAVIGWRDGSIGGPNGEQPSASRWVLWGADKAAARCLPLGSEPPPFEFALYVRRGESVHWENNQGRNFQLNIFEYFQSRRGPDDAPWQSCFKPNRENTDEP